MARYVTKSFVADDCAFEPREQPLRLEVIASDEMTSTGILDANGEMVYRVREPVGFVRQKR